MSIKNVRLNQAINDIIANSVREGYLPSSRVVLGQMADYIFEHDLSKPMLKLIRISKGDIASSVLYNTRLDEMYEDMYLLFQRLMIHEQNLENAIHRAKDQRIYIQNQINVIKDEIETLALKFNNKGITDVLFDTFNDSSKVDPANTTAWVDRGVAIGEIQTRSSRLYVDPPTQVVFYGDNNDVVQYGVIKNIFDDDMSGWTCVVKSDEEEDVTVRIIIDFSQYNTPSNSTLPGKKGVLMNRIDMRYTANNNVKIEYEVDSDNKFELPYYPEAEPMRPVYNFPEILVSKMYLTLTKDRADRIVDNKYEYTFNIDDIDFYSFEYYSQAVFQSKTLTSDSNINKVSLSVKEETPDTTTIEYFLAIDKIPSDTDPTKLVDQWIPISSLEDPAPQYDQVIDFMNVEASTSIIYNISPLISKDNQELTNLRWNGIHFYKLGEIPHRLADCLLYRGKNAVTNNGMIIPLNKDKPSVLHTGTDTILEFCVFCMQHYSFNATPITSMEYSINVNNVDINGIGPLAYNLRRGWNHFRITLKGNGSFDIGHNLTKAGTVYASDKPMEKVDLFDLQRNVKINDHQKYSIKDNCIVVNNYIPGVEYELVYQYISKEIHDIKIKAVLNGNGSTITPKLYAYYINII
jgi:hypothetical protein